MPIEMGTSWSDVWLGGSWVSASKGVRQIPFPFSPSRYHVSRRPRLIWPGGPGGIDMHLPTY